MKTIVMLMFVCAAYFAPALTATNRKHANAMAIFALNLFLGWTMIGWIISLVWALTSQRSSQEKS